MKLFTEPTVEVEKFELVDVITTSETIPDWGMGGEDI